MKKIISAAAAGALLTGAAFADVSFAANARVYSDVFSYRSPSNTTQALDDTGEGVDDNGVVTWAKDTKHADDVTLNAKGSNAGAKIVFNVTSAVQSMDAADTKTDVNLTSYQLWANFGKLRIDAGAYDQRLGKALNDDGNWGTNYSGVNKPGIWVNIDGKSWGKDATNLTVLNGNKTRTNFQLSTKLSDQLTLRGALFLTTAGTVANGDSSDKNDKSDPWIFTPFALGAEYQIDKNSKFAVVAKLNSITQGQGKTTAASEKYEKVTYYTETGVAAAVAAKGTGLYKVDGEYVAYTNLTDAQKVKLFGSTDPTLYVVDMDNSELNEGGDKYYKGTTVYVLKNTEEEYTYTKPQNSVWTLAFDYYNKLNDSLEIEAAYTLGASIYTNNGKHGAYWDSVNKGESTHLVRDNDVFAHGFDFRVADKLSKELSVTGIVGVNYVQGTGYQKVENKKDAANDAYKDARARAYDNGAAGILAYYATVSADYAASDSVTFQVQAKVADNNLFSVGTGYHGDTAIKHVDYLDGLTLNIRPGIILTAEKNCQFFAGFDFGIAGFKTSASGKENAVYTTYTIPIGLRVKL